MEGEYIAGWAPVEDGSRGYVETHLTRLERTLAITPPGGPEDRILEMGAYLHITPALKTRSATARFAAAITAPPAAPTIAALPPNPARNFECCD